MKAKRWEGQHDAGRVSGQNPPGQNPFGQNPLGVGQNPTCLSFQKKTKEKQLYEVGVLICN